jgi:mono/diheme cytochrome c family protein
MRTTKIACPCCGVGLKVADGIAPDTRLKCPKCKNGFRVPADEEAAPRRPAPRKARRKKPEPSKAPMVVGLVAGLVLLLGGGGALAAVVLSSRKKAEPVAENKGPTPPAYAQQAMMTPQGPMGPGQAIPQPIAPETSGPAPESASSPGEKVYLQHGCARCHALDGNVGRGGGPGGRGGRRKVDLRGVGGRRTLEGMVSFIRNPKAQGSTLDMPAYEGKISDQDLRALTEFLAGVR